MGSKSRTTVSLGDDDDPNLGAGAYHGTTLFTDGTEIGLAEIAAPRADVSTPETVSYTPSDALEAKDIDVFLDENRTSTDVRTLSYEADSNLSLP